MSALQGYCGCSPHARAPACLPRHYVATTYRLCVRIALLLFVASCLIVQNTSCARDQTLSTSLHSPTRHVDPSQTHVAALLTSARCAPRVDGWDHVSGAALHDVGYHAAAVTLGRHVLVMGGVAAVPPSVDIYNYTVHHTLRGMNYFDPKENQMGVLEEIQPNTSGVDCLTQRLKQQTDDGRLASVKDGSRCIEAQSGSGTLTARLPVPVVGSGSVVRVHNRVYAFGACNTLPANVHLDLLQKAERGKHKPGTESTTPSSSSLEVRHVEDYLRSVLQINFYHQEDTLRETHAVQYHVHHQPQSMTLRVNATCVAGARGVVYMLGGVSARTGQPLTSVAQYDTETSTFTEGVWSLDEPASTPAAAADNGFLFLSGGFSVAADPTIFNPSRQRRDYRTHIGVVDTHRGIFVRDIARYASDRAAGELQWSSPQLFVRGTALFVMGTGGRTAYGGVAYWPNLSAAPSLSSPPPIIDEEDGPDENPFLLHTDDGTQTDEAGRRSRAPQRDKAAEVLPFAEFSLVPARQDAVVAMVPADDGTSVSFYLFGGRNPALPEEEDAAYRTVAEADVFRATFHLCAEDGDDDVDAVFGRAAVPKVAMRRHEMVALPRALGFSYTRGSGERHERHDIEQPSAADDDFASGVAAAHAVVEFNGPAAANRSGEINVRVNGYVPLWYNTSFSVLLSYAETARACPGIEASTDNANASSFWSCALLLSSSPQCDEPIVEFTDLCAANVRVTTTPIYNDVGNVVGRQKAFAVARALFVGSLNHGLVQVIASGENGRMVVVNTTHTGDQSEAPSSPARLHPLTSSTLQEKTQKSEKLEHPTVYYEQSLVYVCFSRRPSVVANCEAAQQRSKAEQLRHVRADSSAPPLRQQDVVCSTRFYQALSPMDAFILAPEVARTNSSDGEDPIAPTPTPSHLLRPWMLLSTLSVLVVVIVAYMLIAFVLMPGYAFSRHRRHNMGGNEYAVVGRPDHEQQRSLLPYREARIFLGVGGGGGGGGAGGGFASGIGGVGGSAGADGFVYDDLPDEYETALSVAGVGTPFTTLEASWETAETATRRRRLLDGKYEVIRKLGKGSFSVVYLVRRISDNTTFALKYLQCSDDVDRHEAMKECEVVYALQGHPNVIQLFDMFMSYRFDRHMVTVPQSRPDREAALKRATTVVGGGNKKREKKDGVAKMKERGFKEGERPAAVEIAGAEANPLRSRNNSQRLLSTTTREDAAPPTQANDKPLDRTTKEGPAFASPRERATTDLNNNKNNNTKSTSSVSLAEAESPMDTCTSSAVVGVRGRRKSPTSAHGGAALDQQSPLTTSSSNTTSAAASTVSRPVVRLDSTYLDAMGAGMGPDDSSESPTTPQPFPFQEQRGDEKVSADAPQDDLAAASPHHQRGLSSLQAERYLSLVMAYHERGDLARWVRQRRALQPLIPEATVVSIAFQVLSLLSFMHHRHQPPIIHRDLKPENILLTTHVRYENVNEDFLPIVVTDFGLSRVMDKTFCETGVGSLPYVAPECWQRRYSAKVDIWALGCVLYAVCAKRVDSSNVKVMFSECTHPDFHARLRHELENIYGYSDALAWFIATLLAADPADRPTAAEALCMLRRQPTNEKGEVRFYGPPLAALLRAAPASTSTHGQQQQQQRDQHELQAERPILLPTLPFTTTPSTSEASVTPLEAPRSAEEAEAAVQPSSPAAAPFMKRSDESSPRANGTVRTSVAKAAADTTAGRPDAVSSTSTMSSTRVTSTQPPGSAQRTQWRTADDRSEEQDVAEAATWEPELAGVQRIPSFSVPSSALTVAPLPSSADASEVEA